MIAINRLILAVICVGLSACAQSPTFYTAKNKPTHGWFPVTKPVILIADTQEHEEAGSPWLIAPIADHYAEVTIRPVQQTLFSKAFLEHAILQPAHKTKKPVIHLGDLLDVSCASEWHRVRSIFEEANKALIPWAIAPGNHDGFYMGLASPPVATVGSKNSDDLKNVIGASGWSIRCRRANMAYGHPLANRPDRIPGVEGDISEYSYEKKPIVNFDKAWFLSSYLGLVAHGKTQDLSSLRTALTGVASMSAITITQHLGSMQTTGEWTNTTKDQGLLQGMAWHIEPDHSQQKKSTTQQGKPWRSYLIQKLLLPASNDARAEPILTFLLDSTNYANSKEALLSSDSLWTAWQYVKDNAGTQGEISEHQINHLIKWLDDAKSFNGIRYTLMSHHPWVDLNKESRDRLQERVFARFGKPIAYVSAHTHSAAWYKHIVDSVNSKAEMIELNLGSLNDWPVHGRELSIHQSTTKQFELAISAPLMLDNEKALGCEKSDSEAEQKQAEVLQNSAVIDTRYLLKQFDGEYQSSQAKLSLDASNESALTQCAEKPSITMQDCVSRLTQLLYFNRLAQAQLNAYLKIYEKFPNSISQEHPIRLLRDNRWIKNGKEPEGKIDEDTLGGYKVLYAPERIYGSNASFLSPNKKTPNLSNLMTLLEEVQHLKTNACLYSFDQWACMRAQLNSANNSYEAATVYIDAIEKQISFAVRALPELKRHLMCQALAASRQDYDFQKSKSSSGASYRTVENPRNFWKNSWAETTQYELFKK